jgi:hypothetical protein
MASLKVITTITSSDATSDTLALTYSDTLTIGNPVINIAKVAVLHTGATTDWADLEVGDLFIHLPAAAGNSRAGAVATVGTAPFAGVNGDFYIVFKNYTS